MVLSFLLLLLSLVRFSETAIPACFQGWKMNTKSSNSSTSDVPTCGKFVTRHSKGWFDAMTACKAMGSTLFFIKDTDDNDFLTLQFPPSLNEEFWIGLHRNASTWMWSSGDNFIGLSKFKDQNSVHSCATVDKSGYWIPRNCSEPHPYICKMQATACPTEEKWVQSQGLCYKVMAGWPDSTWSDARLNCKTLQADLAVFNDHNNPLTRSPFLVSHLNLTEHWIGMRYNTTLRNFTWLDGDTVSFVNATVGGPDATCGAVSVSSGGLILPKRDDCNKKKGFICELAFFEVVSTTAPTGSSTENTKTLTTTSSSSTKTSPSSTTSSFISDATSSIVTSPSVSTLKISSFSSTVTQAMVAPTLHADSSSNSSDTGASILSVSPFSNSGNKLGRGFFPDTDFTAGSARNGVFYSCNHQISHTSICSQNSQIPGDISQSSDGGSSTNRNAHVSGRTKKTTRTTKPTSLAMILKAANIINTATDFIAQGTMLTTVGELVSPHNLTFISNANNAANDTELATNTNLNSFPYSDYVTAYEDFDSSSDDQSNFSITTSALRPTLVINKELLTPPLANGSIGTSVTTQLSQASFITASVILSQNATSSPYITTVNDSSSNLPINDVAGGSTAIVLPTLNGGGNSSSPIYVPDRSLKSPNEKFQRCLTLAPSLKLSCLHQEIFPFERLCGKDQAFSDYVDELTNSSSYVNETVEAFADVVNDLLQPSVFDELPCIPTTVFSKLSETIERMMANVGSTGFFYTLPKLEVFMSSQSPQSITSFQYEGSIPNTIVNILSFEDNSPTARIGENIQVSILMLNTMYSSSKVNFSNSNGEMETVYLVSPMMCLSAYSKTQRYSVKNSFQLPHLSKSSLFQIHKENINKSVVNYLCAFYKSDEGTWSTEGCSVISMDDVTTTCYCDHTTSFAILMQITDVEIPKEHELALSIITYIGCSVSLISMFIAVTVFTCVQSLNSERVAVHRNLCIAIGLAQVAFLAGIKATHHQLVCRVVALILHYSYTAVFIWMLVEGLHLYTKVVQVFGTEKSRIAYYLSFGWGVPLVLVTISAVADWEGYGTPTSCWLSIKRSTIWAFVGPAIAVIIVNIVILILVIRIVISSAKLDSRGEYDHIKAGIKGALFLLPLLGLTWIFGLLCVNKDLMVFQYLFASFNSLQGFFIFLFHCALNSEVRQALKRMRDRHLLQRGDVITNSTTSSAPDFYGSSSHPEAGDSRYNSKYVDAFKTYRILHVSKRDKSSPKPSHSIKSERTDSQNSGRTRDTVLSRHGQSPDMLFPNDQLALIYI